MERIEITVTRTHPNVIEYMVSCDGEERTYHANREATFFGPHTGQPGRQVWGPASTVWRESDAELKKVLRRKYRGAVIRVV